MWSVAQVDGPMWETLGTVASIHVVHISQTLVKCHLESPVLLGQGLRDEGNHSSFAEEKTEA